jgi:hypothetical protein
MMVVVTLSATSFFGTVMSMFNDSGFYKIHFLLTSAIASTMFMPVTAMLMRHFNIYNLYRLIIIPMCAGIALNWLGKHHLAINAR